MSDKHQIWKSYIGYQILGLIFYNVYSASIFHIDGLVMSIFIVSLLLLTYKYLVVYLPKKMAKPYDSVMIIEALT